MSCRSDECRVTFVILHSWQFRSFEDCTWHLHCIKYFDFSLSLIFNKILFDIASRTNYSKWEHHKETSCKDILWLVSNPYFSEKVFYLHHNWHRIKEVCFLKIPISCFSCSVAFCGWVAGQGQRSRAWPRMQATESKVRHQRFLN